MAGTTADSEVGPDIAVIIPAFRAASTIGRCLEELEQQLDQAARASVPGAPSLEAREDPAVEVVVVASGDDETAELVRSTFPWVRLLGHEGRLYPGGARHVAITQTSASVLAFLDADCVPGPHWLEAVRNAFECEPRADVVGGPVAADLPLGTVGWAAYLCSFLNWVPDGRPRLVDDIPTCSLVFRRSAYERFGPFRQSGYSSDTEFNWNVVAGGGRLLLLPGLEVRHLDRSSLRGFLRRQFQRGLAFATMRATVHGLPMYRRFLLAGGMFLLPAVLCWRQVRRLASPGIAYPYRWGALRSLPLQVIGYMLWSGGEMLGYAGVAEPAGATGDRVES